jgi:hypothetical protein
MNNPNEITYFAETDARNRRVTFGIKAEDRTRHVYVIGKTGMGKSTLLENMAAQDIRNGNGFAFLDPHGSAIDTLLEYIPKERIEDVIYFAPFDMEFPISFNVMEDVGYDKRHLVVSGLMSTFKKIWQDAWSARMEYILGNTLLALLEYPNATLLDVNKMLADKAFRNKVVDNVTDHAVKSFWVDEFAKYTDRFAAEATPAIQNKIGQFTANPLIRNIIGQPKSSFDLRKIMDDRKILLVNLSKGRIGESNANLLGSMLITKLYLSALSRADVSKADMKSLPNFYVFVDEFQSFANDSFADILSEARKYKLNLTIAHQYIEQMTDDVRAAVFGNVGTMITFRVGSFDAEVLEKEFAPVFTAEDIVNLGFAQIYLRLMIDGIGSQPFSAKTIAPLEIPESSYREEIIGFSRKNFAFPRLEVEEFIKHIHDDKGDGNDGGGNDGSNSSGGGGNHGGKNNRGGGSRNGGNQGGGRNNSVGHNGQSSSGSRNDGEGRQYSQKQKSRPAIDKETNKALQQQLKEIQERKKLQAELIENDNNVEEDLKEISLGDLTLNTQNGSNKKHKQANPKEKKGIDDSGNNNQNKKSIEKSVQKPGEKSKDPSPENKNSLKSALAGILGEIKEGDKGGDDKGSGESAGESVDRKKHNKTTKPKNFVKKEAPETTPSQPASGKKSVGEIPEEELRKILEV